jgi:murein DD-endopeptidase MepM/ murein hydrolase activator NlpD
MRWIISLLLVGCASSTDTRHLVFTPSLSIEEEAALSLSPPVFSKATLVAGKNELLAEDLSVLYQKNLLLPVDGIKTSQLKDTFTAPRSGGRVHKAIDILAPYNTKIYAVTDGIIHKMNSDPRGGISIYQVDPSGAFVYYYAHLDHYAENLQEGLVVKRGDLIGYVGDTGNAKGTPHLHFSIFKVTDTKTWWKGLSINPYFVLTQKPYPL